MGLINAEDPYAVFEAIGRLGEHARRHGEHHRRQRPVGVTCPDPTIEMAAKRLAAEAWAAMNERRLAGDVWYVAREKALAPRLAEWNRAYGTACAKRAHAIVMSLDPHAAPEYVLRHEHDEITRLLIQQKLKRGKKITWLDRLCLRYFGLLL